jgi:hypothetical protein
MNTVMISTTIYANDVWRLYRKANKNVTFIVAGDRKTPHDKMRALAADVGNMVYLSDEDQEKAGWACSEFIGWNCIMRRSVALLEAIKMGADVIVTVDDDNIPLEPETYFSTFDAVLTLPFSGPMVHGGLAWFNVGDLFDEPFAHRGFPFLPAPHGYVVQSVTDAPVGVVAGMWMGDPDVTAAERIAKAPTVRSIPGLLQRGVVVERGTVAPFDSQNTAYLGELAPLMAVLPAVGRYDDIWASFIAQRIMLEKNYHVFFGPPFVWQERNTHNLTRNLQDEIYGMDNTVQFVRDLDRMRLGTGSPLEMLGRLWSQAQKLDYLPQRLKDFGRAWVEDVEGVI